MFAAGGCLMSSQGQQPSGGAEGNHGCYSHQAAADTDCIVGELFGGEMRGGGFLHLFYDHHGCSQVLLVYSVVVVAGDTVVVASVAGHIASALAASAASAVAAASIEVVAVAAAIITVAAAVVNIAVVVVGKVAGEGWHMVVVDGRKERHHGQQPCGVGPDQSYTHSDREQYLEGWTCQLAGGRSCMKLRMKIVGLKMFESWEEEVGTGVVSGTRG